LNTAPTGTAGGRRTDRRATSAPDVYWNRTRSVVASSQMTLQ
jgi:hypothetical protein